MKTLLICVTIVLGTPAFAQIKEKLLLDVNTLPVRQGKIFEIQYYPARCLRTQIDEV